ncbi:MAG: 50S ribosomal protein L25/general stress protein Ctc [Gemmatimonadales bacterium]
MAQTSTLNATPRAASGKGVARSLRRAGQIPAVIYGRGRDPEGLALDATALNRMLTKVRAATTILDVHVGDREPVKALIREIQRDPVKAEIIHIDLYEVHADEAITVEVPLRFVGTAEGVRNSGGVFEAISHTIELEVLPGNIPEFIEVDVSALGVGQSLHVGDLSFSAGKILTDDGVTICTVVAAKVEEAAPAEAEAEAAAVEPELIRKPKAEDEGDEE